MDTAQAYSSDVAFTPTVKALQARKGSRAAYGRMEEKGAWRTRISPDLKEFIEAQTSVFLATVNAYSQPYIQHRGGPPGFLRVLDDRNIAYDVTPRLVRGLDYYTHTTFEFLHGALGAQNAICGGAENRNGRPRTSR